MKVEIKAFVTMVKHEWSEKPHFTLDCHDMSDVGPDYVPIREQVFEIDIPDDFDPRPIQVAALRKKKTKVLAEAQAAATNIEEQIQRLLCLEAPKADEPEVLF